MSQNYQNQNPKRLHSPLLDGYIKTENLKTSLKEKKQIYKPTNGNRMPQEQNNHNEIDKTIETTLFNQNYNQKELSSGLSKEIINEKSIDSLDTSFKVAGIFIVALGSVLGLLQLIMIGTSLYNGNYALGNSLLVFAAVTIGTVLANTIAMGFSHMIKMTRYIYSDLEEQKSKMNDILEYYNRVNYKVQIKGETR
jgi:hypothetical protein